MIYISTAGLTFFLTKKAPVSNAEFQLIPQSLRLIFS